MAAPGEQACPICGSPVPPSPRYPRQLCRACAQGATDAAGRPLRFQNVSVSGGFAAFLNAAFGICLGCLIYPVAARLLPKSAATATPNP